MLGLLSATPGPLATNIPLITQPAPHNIEEQCFRGSGAALGLYRQTPNTFQKTLLPTNMAITDPNSQTQVKIRSYSAKL